MKVLALHSAKEPDRAVARAFAMGVAMADTGDEGMAMPSDDADGVDCDVAALFGVKARLRFAAYRDAGKHTVVLDKGYVRRPLEGWRWCEFWRVALDAHHPTNYLGSLRSSAERFEALGIAVEPWRKRGDHIILAGSSDKFHRFNNLAEPTKYATCVVREIRERSTRPIFYRPKPSWADAVPVPGTIFAKLPKRIEPLLRGAHALVTNGSNACFEAVLHGVPCVILGDAVAKPISSTSIAEIEAPRLAPAAEREQWLADIANCQFTLREMRAGLAWKHLRGVLNAN